MTNIHHAENIIYEAITGDGFSAPELRTRHAARALADAGLLAPEPQVVRTRDELAALDPDTVLLGGELILLTAADCVENSGFPLYDNDQLAVVATGDQVRAARQALEDTDATD